MSMWHCCLDSDKISTKGHINQGKFSFIYYLTYCKNCGSVSSTGMIKDGKIIKEDSET
jgi:hypothetical protein